MSVKTVVFKNQSHDYNLYDSKRNENALSDCMSTWTQRDHETNKYKVGFSGWLT